MAARTCNDWLSPGVSAEEDEDAMGAGPVDLVSAGFCSGAAATSGRLWAGGRDKGGATVDCFVVARAIGAIATAGGSPGGGGGGVRAEEAGRSTAVLATLGFLDGGGAEGFEAARRLSGAGCRGAPSVEADLAPRGMERLTVAAVTVAAGVERERVVRGGARRLGRRPADLKNVPGPDI